MEETKLETKSSYDLFVQLASLFHKINLWPIVLVQATILFYWLAVASVSWYVYLVAASIVAERGLLQLRLFINKYVSDMVLRKMVSSFSASSQYNPEAGIPMLPPTAPEVDE